VNGYQNFSDSSGKPHRGRGQARDGSLLPPRLGDIAWGIDWAIQALGLYHQKIHVLSEMNKTIACSIEKAKQDLGYLPAVALEEGMRRSLRWMVDSGLHV
jgi:hypothetical protein